jgi:hypothetical protein
MFYEARLHNGAGAARIQYRPIYVMYLLSRGFGCLGRCPKIACFHWKAWSSLAQFLVLARDYLSLIFGPATVPFRLSVSAGLFKIKSIYDSHRPKYSSTWTTHLLPIRGNRAVSQLSRKLFDAFQCKLVIIMFPVRHAIVNMQFPW